MRATFKIGTNAMITSSQLPYLTQEKRKKKMKGFHMSTIAPH